MATFKQYTNKKNEKLWLFQIYLGVDEATGKEIRTTRRGFKTKKECQLEAKRLAVEFEAGGLKKRVENSFKEIYELWFDSHRNTVKESTANIIEGLFNNHILPVFGAMKVDKITLKMAQKEVNYWAEKLKKYKIVLVYCVKVMDFAINLDLINTNPFDKVIRPASLKSKEEKKLKYYTMEEVQQVMTHLESKVKQSENFPLVKKYFSEYDLTLYRLLAFTGLRIGEALALTFSDIDFTEKTITVNKSLSDKKKGFNVSTPKTSNSNRTISVDDKTLRILKRWQLRQREMLFANRTKPTEYLFVNIYGELISRNAIYSRSNRIAKEVGLHQIGNHGWRHSHASMLFDANVTLKEIQIRLGHSTIELTSSTYVHLSKKTQERTVDKLARFANF